MLAGGEELAFQLGSHGRFPSATQASQPDNQAAMAIALFALRRGDFIVGLPRIEQQPVRS
jgi:hypothetical protein